MMTKKTKRQRKPKSPQALLISRARQVWAWSEEKRFAKAKARTKSGWARCAKCGKEVPEIQTHVDHRDPVVPVTETGPKLVPGEGAVGWDRYYTRLFVYPAALDVLCELCHSLKTKAERDLRTARRRREKAEKKNGEKA